MRRSIRPTHGEAPCSFPDTLADRRLSTSSSVAAPATRGIIPAPRVPEHPIEVAVVQPEKLARIRPSSRHKLGIRVDRPDAAPCEVS